MSNDVHITINANGQPRKVGERGIAGGSLSRRGDRWYGRWMFEGKRFSKALGVFSGPHAREHAQNALDAATLPYRAKYRLEVEQFAYARLKAAESDVKSVEEQKPAMRVADAFDAFAVHPMRPRRAMKDGGADMIRQYRSRFERFAGWLSSVHPEIVELRAVSKDVAFEFLKGFAVTVSANTYNKYLTFLSTLWNVLREEARLTFNPWSEVRHVPQPKSVRRELSIEELATVAQNAGGEMFLLFAIGVYTGLRLGDAVRLRWSAVDFAKNHITVEPTKTERFTKGVPVVIPLVPRFREILCNVPEEKRKGWIVPGLADKYSRRESGRGDVSKAVQRVFSAAGIDTQVQGDRCRARVAVGFHSLRHTFVSIAATSGIPLAVVQAIVGHSSPAMTQHYLHVSETALQADVSKFPGVFGGSSDGARAASEAATVARIREEVRRLSVDGRAEVVRACLSGLSASERRKALSHRQED